MDEYDETITPMTEQDISNSQRRTNMVNYVLQHFGATCSAMDGNNLLPFNNINEQ